MITADNLWDFAVSMLYHEGESEPSLRRAISACYYAVFHAIAVAGSEAFDAPQSLRNRIARSYEHSSVLAVAKDTEKRFGSTASSGAEEKLLQLAQAFRRLQEKRNRADYDLSATITWEEADELLDEAGRALNALTLLKGQDILAEFVLSPLLRDRSRRG